MKHADKHITFYQSVSSYLGGVINSLRILSEYQRTYRNCLSIIIHILRKEYPLEALLKNGQEIVLKSFEQSYNIARLQNQKEVSLDIASDTVRIINPAYRNTQEIMLKGGIENGEIANIFVKDVYQNFPVAGKIVLDVGANIADSCIYFALRGATNVIGIEPVFENYKTAEENIKLNDYSNTITVVWAACSPKPGRGNIIADRKKGIGSQIESNQNRGTLVPFLTLDQILEQYDVRQKEIVLKMDCEGCEYEIISSAPKSVLRRFSNILIEYHYGYRDIKEKLDKCNFEVFLIKQSGKSGGPTAMPDPERLGHWYHMGYILAKRRNED